MLSIIRHSSKYLVLNFSICALFLHGQTGALALEANNSAQPLSFTEYSGMDFFSYEELQYLSEHPKPKGELKKRLEKFWRTPLIDNRAFYAGAKPKNLNHSLLGPYISVAGWNIEKSLNMDKVIDLFTNDNRYNALISAETKSDPRDVAVADRQRQRLLNSDIILLQEMEIGLKRSKYWNAAEKLAQALDMNYTFAPQYLEVDPVVLGLESVAYDDGSEDTVALDYYHVDPEQYKGVFGSAVLSRYPIKHVEVRPLITQPYDWYAQEKEKIGFLEKSRRFGTKTLFLNELTREMKIGGRHYFRVDLEVPGVPNNTLTIINIHLEIKCEPKDRHAQMKEILSYIKDIQNPVIMMGDYNAAPTDISPTNLKRVATKTAKNPSTWVGVALNVAGSSLNVPRVATNFVKNFNDPFAIDIKAVAANPLKPMFDMIRNYTFSDGTMFDFRGDSNRSVGNKDELLANSNQRGTKGFVTSFSVKRALGVVGKYRLDWIFVKSFLYAGENIHGPYRLAPHFGETLEELNTSFTEPLSDHHPSVFDLPLEEPALERIEKSLVDKIL